jgi:hypothetical protein
VKSLDVIIETEKYARLAVNGLSVLRQMGHRLNLETDGHLCVENSWLWLVLKRGCFEWSSENANRMP